MEISGVILVLKIFSQTLLMKMCLKMILRYTVMHYDDNLMIIFLPLFRVQLSSTVPVLTLQCHIIMVLLSNWKGPLNRLAR